MGARGKQRGGWYGVGRAEAVAAGLEPRARSARTASACIAICPSPALATLGHPLPLRGARGRTPATPSVKIPTPRSLIAPHPGKFYPLFTIHSPDCAAV